MLEPSPFIVEAEPSRNGAARHAGPIDWPALKARIVAGLDVEAEYRALGVRFTGGAGGPGWRECYAVRDGGNADDTPSAAVNVETGVYKDSGDGGAVMGLLDFAVKHGPWGNWRETVKHFAAKAGVELPYITSHSKGRIREAEYLYRDEAGEVRYCVFRYRLPNGKKSFSQHPPDGKGGWRYGPGCMDGVGPLPYRLPELLASEDAIWVVEGEQDADRLRSLGFTATTSHGGAGNTEATWPRFRSEWFAGRACLVIPDNDESGRRHARRVAEWLAEAGASVLWLELPGLPPRGDVSDWLDLGNPVEDLGKLAYHAPAFDPGNPPEAEAPDDDESRDATVADLRPFLSKQAWFWPNWIPNDALTLFAAEPGTGKTRFCMDLHRRLVQQLPWPDGEPTPEVAEPKALWIAADGQFPELCSIPEEFGIPDHLVILNAPVADPFAGTTLQTAEDFLDLEARIARVRPAIVFIDTVNNASDFKIQDASDAKKQYKPLQEIASRVHVPIVCVTHLNAGGKVLGRRAVEKARVVIQMDWPDKENQPNRRKLHVTKSKALTPPPLGVTMGATGNEYDDEPPTEPEGDRIGGARTGPTPAKTRACMDWLATRLALGDAMVMHLRADAEEAGFDAKQLYRAKKELGVEESERGGRKWWSLNGKQEDEPDF